jgi:RNA polymerase sigma factor (sigma-70 family)
MTRIEEIIGPEKDEVIRWEKLYLWAEACIRKVITRRGHWDLFNDEDVTYIVSDFMFKVNAGVLDGYTGKDGAKVKSYAFSIILNIEFDAARRKIADKGLDSDGLSDEKEGQVDPFVFIMLKKETAHTVTEKKIDLKVLFYFIEHRISKRDMEILERHYLEDQSIEEIAEVYCTNVGTIRVQISRAKKLLWEEFTAGKIQEEDFV